MAVYYQHSHGCGSGYVDSYIKLDPDNKLSIRLRYGWMGDERLNYNLLCTLLPISKPYNMLRVDQFTELCKDGNKEHKEDAYFDTYIFDDVLETEWLKYPIDDIPIGLYMGNGCRSTEKFQLQMNVNKSVVSSIDKDSPLQKIIRIIDGLKYEIITEEQYNKKVSITLF